MRERGREGSHCQDFSKNEREGGRRERERMSGFREAGTTFWPRPNLRNLVAKREKQEGGKSWVKKRKEKEREGRGEGDVLEQEKVQGL